MADAILDFAGLDSAAATTESSVDAEQNLDNLGTEEVVETTENTESENKEGTKEVDADASEGVSKEGEEGQDVKPVEATPDSIRKTLRSWRDADKKNSEVVKSLHNSFERWNAAKEIFPTVKEMREAQEFISLVGGPEGYERLNGMVKAVEASDQKLYSGDSTLWDDVVEDLRSENKLDSLGKLAPGFFEAVKKHDKDGWYEAFAPQFLSGIEEVNLHGAINAVMTALKVEDNATPEQLKAAIASVSKIVGGMNEWYKGLKQTSEAAKSKQLDPERVKLLEERKKFLQEQEQFKTSKSEEFQKGVATECSKVDNTALGAELKGYLKLDFFKGFPKETLKDLASGIKDRLFTTLKSDKNYQAQMKALWGAKEPDRNKIIEYHTSKLKSIAADVVRLTVQQRYPGYAKGGSAAGRVAAKSQKVEAQKKADQKSVDTGKPQYVPQKPAWDAIDWDKDPKQLLYVTGKAYLKGSNRFVTWRK